MSRISVSRRPRVVGIDDGPFDHHLDSKATVVAVVTEGADVVEAVAIARFPVDGDDATGFLGRWLGGVQATKSAHAVMLGGVTLAGLGVVDIAALSHELGLPVLAVNRREPKPGPLIGALRAAGLEDRIPLVERLPRSGCIDDGLWVAPAGAGDEEIRRLVTATRGKSRLPEALRLAHLIAGAVVRGESTGRP